MPLKKHINIIKHLEDEINEQFESALRQLDKLERENRELKEEKKEREAAHETAFSDARAKHEHEVFELRQTLCEYEAKAEEFERRLEQINSTVSLLQQEKYYYKLSSYCN